MKLSMNDELKLLYLKIIYEKLGLSEIEKEIKEKGILPKKIVNDGNYPLTSNYFFLKNDVIFTRLSDEEKKQLEKYYKEYKENNNKMFEEFNDFLDKNMLKLLLPDTEEENIYWGPIHDDFMTKNDVIALAFHFLEFDNDNPMSREQMRYLCNKINYIQFELGPKKGIRVGVLMYNEVVQMQEYSNFSNIR